MGEYNISGGNIGAVGDGAKAENFTIHSQSIETNDITKITDLIKQTIEELKDDTSIPEEGKEKLTKVLNTTKKEIENKNRNNDMLEVCADNMENINNVIDKGTKTFTLVSGLVTGIRLFLGI